MIKEFLIDKFERAVLFARPRRFGKTLTMTMFKDFPDIYQDSREIFKGLEIMNYTDLVKSYMNCYPVVFVSLKELSGDSYGQIVKNLRNIASNVCKKYSYFVTVPKAFEKNFLPHKASFNAVKKFFQSISP